MFLMKTGVTVVGVWTSSLFRLLNIGQDIIPHSLPAQVFLYETEKGLAVGVHDQKVRDFGDFVTVLYDPVCHFDVFAALSQSLGKGMLSQQPPSGVAGFAAVVAALLQPGRGVAVHPGDYKIDFGGFVLLTQQKPGPLQQRAGL